MIAIDTNTLVIEDHLRHAAAVALAESLRARLDVGISEFVLLELSNLLRNPSVMQRPLVAGAAVDVCEAFRQHPVWQLLGFPPESRPFHDAF